MKVMKFTVFAGCFREFPGVFRVFFPMPFPGLCPLDPLKLMHVVPPRLGFNVRIAWGSTSSEQPKFKEGLWKGAGEKPRGRSMFGHVVRVLARFFKSHGNILSEDGSPIQAYLWKSLPRKTPKCQGGTSVERDCPEKCLIPTPKVKRKVRKTPRNVPEDV